MESLFVDIWSFKYGTICLGYCKFLALFLLLALSPLPRLQVYPTHLCVLNRICGDCWHKVTPTGCERHSDIAFFLSSQPLPQSLHPHQIFFYSSLRGKRGGRLRRELTHTECRHSLLYPVLIPNFTHSCACTHTAPAVFFFYSPPGKPQLSFFWVCLTITCLNQMMWILLLCEWDLADLKSANEAPSLIFCLINSGHMSK